MVGSSEAMRDADPEDKMCGELKAAIGDESNAQKEYDKLEMAAKNAGQDFLAETVNQIEKQEASHESIFRKAHDLYCD